MLSDCPRAFNPKPGEFVYIPCGGTPVRQQVRQAHAALAAYRGGATLEEAAKIGAAVGPEKGDKPAPTIKQAASFAQAMLTGTLVSEDVLKERLAICAGCDLFREDRKTGVRFCGVCGCGIKAELKRGANLAAFAENLPKWGCKHPARAEGKGWKR